MCCCIFRSRHTARRGYAGRKQFPLLLQFFDPTGGTVTAVTSSERNGHQNGHQHATTGGD
jgi:hypothetical protein